MNVLENDLDSFSGTAKINRKGSLTGNFFIEREGRMELNNTNTNTENTGAEQEATEKTYSQAEVDALLQQETDRRVTSALKKQEEKLKTKVEEAKKLAVMDEKQRYEFELEQREKRVAEMEKELAISHMKDEATKILADKGLSISLVDLVVNEDADITNENISLLEKSFKQSVKDEVERRLAAKVPLKSLPTNEGSLTREQFYKLSLQEMMQVRDQQPELYEQFTGKHVDKGE